MTLSDVVKRETPAYVSESANDLDVLIDIAYALRSVPESEFVRWLDGFDCLGSWDKHPNPDVKYVGQPVFGLTKEYEVSTPSGNYRFVVTPGKDKGIINNDVKVKFVKNYALGDNKELGDVVKSAEHDVLYLLPLVARLPVKDITYNSVVDFMEKHNGFRIANNSMEESKFHDIYKHARKEKVTEPPLMLKMADGTKKQVSVFDSEKVVKTDMDVYLSVRKIARVDYQGVCISLEIAIPGKNIW